MCVVNMGCPLPVSIFPLNPESADLIRLTGQDFEVYTYPHAGVHMVLLCPAFVWAQGARTWVLMFAYQALYL